MLMTDVYVPLEKLVSNFCGGIVKGEITQSELGTFVTLTIAALATKHLSVVIHFVDGVAVDTHVKVNTELEYGKRLSTLIDIAERVIARHEYHERMKASNPDGK
jgi:hypothetical protein